MAYLFIEENKINGCGQVPAIDETTINYEITDEFYQEFQQNPSKYIWDIETQEPVIDPDYEAKQAEKEAERVAKLNLTGADVERGIYKAKKMDFDDIVAFVTANPPEGLDVKALKIELKANHFYRGNPYVDAVGKLLGFTKEQLDKFFETNDYTYLLSE